MKASRDQRVEDLSELAGGRFRLTTLILKRMRQYYLGGRTFMPRVRSNDELLDMIFDQIEKQEIALRLPGEPSALHGQKEGEQTLQQPETSEADNQ